jgi:hypothetical protein
MNGQQSAADRWRSRPPVALERECVAKSRSARAVEGAVLGAVVGIVSGGIIGGIIFGFDRSAKKAALGVSLGIFGFAVVGQAIATASPPEC